MRFTVYDVRENIQTAMRRVGYAPLGWNEQGELNCVRPLAGKDYPRFHAYVKEEAGKLLFSLHLDQKRPSYGNETAHSGDYESETVHAEERRIQEIFILSAAKG